VAGNPLRRLATRRRSRRETVVSYLFLLPYLILLALFGIFPVCYAFGLSFFDTIEGTFWWFTNYQTAFADFRLGASVVNILVYVVIWVAMTVVGVMALSLMLDTLRRRSATALRSVFFLPGGIAGLATRTKHRSGLELLESAAGPATTDGEP
jgi:multiple sugar transport system permease protein